jgi:1-acyl-sn-glycerol-3-phosphate acyltransferase
LVSGAQDAGGAGDHALAEQPEWPYTWGRFLRLLGLPFDVLYRISVTHTAIGGAEHLRNLPPRVIFAGTHHSFADMPLLRYSLARTPARRLAHRLVIAAAALGWSNSPALTAYCRMAFGLYPLQQYSERDASLRGLVHLAEAGNAILIFPQGMHAEPERERSGDPAVGFKPGIAHIVAALDACVVPLGIAGTERMMPPKLETFGGLVIAGIPVSLRRGPLAINFGEPLTIAHDETAHAFASRLQAASFALTRQAESALAAMQRPK